MKVQKKIPLEIPQLISTTAVESVPAYNAGTTYNIDDQVYYELHIYTSLVNSNTGNTPTTNPTKWLETATRNIYAMFDEQVSSQTTATSPLQVVIKPGQVFDSVGLINISATSYKLVIKDDIGGPTIYDSGTVDLLSTEITDWYQYYFSEFSYLTDVVIENLPLYYNATIYLNLYNTASAVNIGVMNFGTMVDLGGTQYNASVGIKSYSVKTTDEFGNTTFVKRANSKRMQADFYLKNTRLPLVYNVLRDIESVPSIWVGTDTTAYTPFIQYGYYLDFNIVVNQPTSSLCSLEVEGLI